MLLAHDKVYKIISTSTIVPGLLQYDSLVLKHNGKDCSAVFELEPPLPRLKQAMIDQVSQQTQARQPFSRLRKWGDGAERLVLSPDNRHWTNSFILWLSLNILDCLTTWQCLAIGGYETNPFLQLAARTHGDGLMLAGKFTLAFLIGIMVWNRGSRRLKGLLNLGMTLVLITNCVLLCKPLWLLNLYGY